MLVDGTWSDEDRIIEGGRFVRDGSAFSDPFQLDPGTDPSEAPRYWLISSKSCPWSHGATIFRTLLHLETHVGLHIAGGPRLEGYALCGGQTWKVPGADHHIQHLHQLYTLADPQYTGRSTVPVLWDAQTATILCNDSRTILRALNALGREVDDAGLDLAPTELLGDIDAMNDWLFNTLNNAVYRAGFAETQAAYDDAVETVFEALDTLEARLSAQRYLMGDKITEADWRLFPTLLRFDAVYAVLHRCCRKRLVDFPALWSYARELYGWPGVSATVDFDEILRGSYLNDTSHNPNGILPVLPDADWNAPHDRQLLGP